MQSLNSAVVTFSAIFTNTLCVKRLAASFHTLEEMMVVVVRGNSLYDQETVKACITMPS